MARGNYAVRPPSQQTHPPPPGPPTPYGPGQSVLIQDSVEVCTLAGDGSEMIMLPVTYEDRDDWAEDAEWRVRDENGFARKCWQTTRIYELLPAEGGGGGESNAHVIRFIRPDPWTWLPVVENPGGPPLRQFFKDNRNELYDFKPPTAPNERTTTATGRIKPHRKNLVYQWSLHLALALESLHSHAPTLSIVFGDLTVDSCWLTPQLSLSVLGFLNSGFRTQTGPLHVGSILNGHPFDPLGHLPHREQTPTVGTDLFMWGSVVYEFMTGFWPGDGQGLGDDEIATMVPRQEWPGLEREFLGDVVVRCWNGDITSAVELLAEVRRSIVELGAVVVEERDEVGDLDIQGLAI